MHRKYLSGAQKRKVQAGKKAKETAALVKVPKINEIFSVVASPLISDSHSENVNESACIESESDCELDLHTSLETQNASAKTDSVSSTSIAQFSAEDESSDQSVQFTSDAALWNIPTDIKSLQDYWLQNGKYDA